jgi:hypothetical protein
VSAPSAAAPPRTGNPLVDAILGGQAPPPVRLAAARGALPVTRTERLLLCVTLAQDPDPGVRRAAAERLAGEGQEDARAALEAGEGLAAEVLDHFARRADARPELLERLVANPALSHAALETIAGCPHPAVLERIVLNQTRLLAHPPIVARLESNPKLGATGRRLLAEFKHDFLEKSGSTVVLARPEESAAAPEPQGAAAPAAAEEAPAPEPAAEEAAGPIELTAEEAADEAFKAAYVRIMGLSVPEKIQLSIRATREERAILVRDSNRMVAAAVLKSPKLTDQEVEQIANMRNVSDEVLRIIGTNRTWVRNYAVIFALCRNPKTPVGMTVPFLNRLNTRDLKNLLADKNISEAVRKMAKKAFDQRNQANNPAAKKK